MSAIAETVDRPSAWVGRFVPSIRAGGLVLDLADDERLGRPRGPDFLLHPAELLEAFTMLAVIAFEQGEVAVPWPAVVQRIAGSLGRSPEAAGKSNELEAIRLREGEQRSPAG
jgi:hypothetical protein